MTKVKFTVLFLLACSLLTCVGGEVAYKDSKILVWPYKLYEKDDINLSAREYKQQNVSYHYQGNSKQPDFYTEDLVVALWGEPSSVIKEKGASIWIYNDGNKILNGLRLYFIIPISFLFEDGNAYYRLRFQDGKVVKAQHTSTYLSGIRCGLLVQPFNWSTGKTGSFCSIK